MSQTDIDRYYNLWNKMEDYSDDEYQFLIKHIKNKK